MDFLSLYKNRRDNLLKALPEQSVLLLPSAPFAKRSGDVNYLYRPSSNLIYFTGFTENLACLMLIKTYSFKKSILFVQRKEPVKELWTGPVYGPEKTSELFQIDLCYPTEDFLKKATEILKKQKKLYYFFGLDPEWDLKVKKLISSLKEKKKQISVLDPTPLICTMRMKKQKPEIKLIKKAVDISCRAHQKVITMAKTGLNERVLHGCFISEIKNFGSDFEAYPGIFASGEKACILHYTDNNKNLKSGELMLVDAGAEYKYYASDITRTFPVNKKFKNFQKRIYNRVLFAQKELIKILKPGLSFKNIQKTLIHLLSEQLKEEKIFSHSSKQIIEKKLYKKYFPHSFGHLLGLDVHDLSPPKTEDITLEENFVLTIEPGLYFPLKDSSIPDNLKGLGIRIEDDILITQKGAEVLSHQLPKEAEDLENF